MEEIRNNAEESEATIRGERERYDTLQALHERQAREFEEAKYIFSK